MSHGHGNRARGEMGTREWGGGTAGSRGNWAVDSDHVTGVEGSLQLCTATTPNKGLNHEMSFVCLLLCVLHCIILHAFLSFSAG